MTKHSDLEWIQLLKQEDRQAQVDLWTMLYTCGETLLRRGRYFLRRYDGSGEDIIHEATIAAYQRVVTRGIHQYRFQAPFEPFCQHILVNEIWRAQASKGRIEDRTAELDEELPGEDEVRFPGATEVAQERLKSCLGQLLPRAREIIELYYFQGLSSEAIAQRLNLIRNTVDVYAYRARLALRKCLRQFGYETSEDLRIPL